MDSDCVRKPASRPVRKAIEDTHTCKDSIGKTRASITCNVLSSGDKYVGKWHTMKLY